MNKFKLVELEENLESKLLNLIYNKAEETWITPSITGLEDFKNALNEFFDNEFVCTNVVFTDNTDNDFFGVRINPDITPADAIIILTAEEDIKVTKYELEFDSKIFDIGLTATEIISIVIYEISSMLSAATINNVKAIIDLNNLKRDDVIYLRDSINYTQLVIFAIKDTMYKVSSIMFKEDIDDITTNDYIMSAEIDDDLISAMEKINTSVFGNSDTTRGGSPSIMNWMLIMYKDMRHNSRLVKDTLKDAKCFTGSRLVKMEIDKTIASVDKIECEIVIEGGNITKAIEKKNMHSLMELSLFQALKRNGLRSLEDDYYEFQLRVKTCNNEDDALFILRGINSRINILDDYLYSNANLNENERKHWEDLSNAYRQLRNELANKKKINKIKTYGIFTDLSEETDIVNEGEKIDNTVAKIINSLPKYALVKIKYQGKDYKPSWQNIPKKEFDVNTHKGFKYSKMEMYFTAKGYKKVLETLPEDITKKDLSIKKYNRTNLDKTGNQTYANEYQVIFGVLAEGEKVNEEADVTDAKFKEKAIKNDAANANSGNSSDCCASTSGTKENPQID